MRLKVLVLLTVQITVLTHDIPCSLKIQALGHSRILKYIYKAAQCCIPEEIALQFQNSFHKRKSCASFPPVGALLTILFYPLRIPSSGNIRGSG